MFKCLHAKIHVYEGKFVVFKVDAQNMLGIVNRGSPRLRLDELDRARVFLVTFGALDYYHDGTGPAGG